MRADPRAVWDLRPMCLVMDITNNLTNALMRHPSVSDLQVAITAEADDPDVVRFKIQFGPSGRGSSLQNRSSSVGVTQTSESGAALVEQADEEQPPAADEPPPVLPPARQHGERPEDATQPADGAEQSAQPAAAESVFVRGNGAAPAEQVVPNAEVAPPAHLHLHCHGQPAPAAPSCVPQGPQAPSHVGASAPPRSSDQPSMGELNALAAASALAEYDRRAR